MIQSTDTFLCKLRQGRGRRKFEEGLDNPPKGPVLFRGEPNSVHISVQPGEPVGVAGGADTEEKASWRVGLGAGL